MRPTAAPAKTHIATLSNGQVWTFQDELLEIRKVGKHLVQISRTKQPPPGFTGKIKRTAAQYESVRAVLAILNAQQAQLQPVAR